MATPAQVGILDTLVLVVTADFLVLHQLVVIPVTLGSVVTLVTQESVATPGIRA